MTDKIIDIYHGNSIDFERVRSAGIAAIIHKATQGRSMRDSRYQARRSRAKSMGFLWGAYHFSTGESVAAQVENFLEHARPEDDELISLDWEPSNGPDMTLAQARQFVQLIRNETGRWPVIYGGHLLRESVGHDPDPILSNCPLWYARYANTPVGIPTQIWPSYTLWQYTDGEVGPEPRQTPGVSGADRNRFQGTAAQLRQAWPFTRRSDGAPNGAGFAAILASAAATEVRTTRRRNRRAPAADLLAAAEGGCRLTTRAQVSEVVINAIETHLGIGGIKEVTTFDEDLGLDAIARRGLYFPVRNAVAAQGCTLDQLQPSDFEDFETVGDCVDAVAEDLELV